MTETMTTATAASPKAQRLRIAIVLPRFGEVFGGAELLGRWLGEHLLAAGHGVEILTTCAVDHFTWRNALPAGTEDVDGLVVHRFPTDDRDVELYHHYELAIQQGDTLTNEQEMEWLRNGASSRAMEDFLRAESHRFDLVIAMPYLLGTTYFAYRAAPEKTALVPCLHDEAQARLGFVKEMLEGARGLLFNSGPEADLATRLTARPTGFGVVGVGFDRPAQLEASDVASAKARHKLSAPYLFYVGRREGGKNTPLLFDYFLRYKQRRPGDLQLILVGSGDEPPRSPDIRAIDIDWSERDALNAGAVAFCHPGVHESFSIVLMQAWLASTPAIVHGDCAVTRFHAERSNGGLWFTNYAEFEAMVDKLTSSPDLRARLGENGRTYVEREYGWPAVLNRFEEAVGRFLEEVS